MIPSSLPDEKPFERLVRTHQASVWRYLRFLGCNTDLAAELTQETFVAVLDRPVHRFGDAGALAYLRRVAKNALLKYRARVERRSEVDLDVAEAAYEWYRGDDEGESWSTALDACLGDLPERVRKALDLRFAQRYDREELAACLGVTAHGVKSLLQRTYARLRVCIERRLADDGQP